MTIEINDSELKELIRNVVREVIQDELKAISRHSVPDLSPEVMTMTEACKYLGMCRATMYRYTSGGLIPHHKMGKFLRFRKSELFEWVATFRVKTRVEVEAEASRYISKRRGRMK